MTKTQAKLAAIAVIVGCFMALAWVGSADAGSERLERKQYCEMTALYERSGGELGWPAYREGVTCD